MQNPKIKDLAWMCGPWRGSLGAQSAEEAWSEPHAGSMSTMVRLKSAEQVDMIELITIREHEGSLLLHLRQFSPALELLVNQDMPLATLTDNEVSFRLPDAQIQGLQYTRVSDDNMQVTVFFGPDASVTAEFARA